MENLMEQLDELNIKLWEYNISDIKIYKFKGEYDYAIFKINNVNEIEIGAYRSKSELGIWRFCLNLGLFGYNKFYNYVTDTMMYLPIQIILSKFIINNKNEEVNSDNNLCNTHFVNLLKDNFNFKFKFIENIEIDIGNSYEYDAVLFPLLFYNSSFNFNMVLVFDSIDKFRKSQDISFISSEDIVGKINEKLKLDSINYVTYFNECYGQINKQFNVSEYIKCISEYMEKNFTIVSIYKNLYEYDHMLGDSKFNCKINKIILKCEKINKLYEVIYLTYLMEVNNSKLYKKYFENKQYNIIINLNNYAEECNKFGIYDKLKMLGLYAYKPFDYPKNIANESNRECRGLSNDEMNKKTEYELYDYIFIGHLFTNMFPLNKLEQ